VDNEAIPEELSVHDSVDELSDSQSQCSTMSLDPERGGATGSYSTPQKERKDKSQQHKKRKYRQK